jgi:pyruvate formate lyase activating enzyme
MKEALYYKKTGLSVVECFLCPQNCKINDGGLGACRARKNMEGRLYTLNYDMVSSVALDPIEKKPLYRYYPGSMIFSAGTFGCNLKCMFCQNHEIAHGEPETYRIPHKQLVDQALSYKSSIGIAYTYNEPSIWYEYVYDTARLARSKNLKNVMVTNGYISEEPLEELLKYIDAANIDVKSFNDDYYVKICKAKLEHVKKRVEQYLKKCHIEITFLAVPGLNDGMDEMKELSQWLASLDRSIPLHIIRFRPLYMMKDHKAQTYDRVLKLQEEASKYLDYVYAH